MGEGDPAVIRQKAHWWQTLIEALDINELISPSHELLEEIIVVLLRFL